MKTFLFALFIIAILFSYANAADNEYSKNPTQSGEQIKQKELNNINDYNSMVKDLKQGITLGNLDSIFYLGVVYLNGVTLKDGTVVEKDEINGRGLLFKAIKQGSLKSLGVLAAKSISSLDISTFSTAVKIAQQSKFINISDKDYYSLMLASLILDADSNDANAIEITTKWIYEAEKKRPTPKLQFILASIYSKLGNINAANYYLNKSCSDKSMAKMCQEFKDTGVKK